jgi:hypothetical protein
MAWPAVLYFSTLYHKRHFLPKTLFNMKYVFLLFLYNIYFLVMGRCIYLVKLDLVSSVKMCEVLRLLRVQVSIMFVLNHT